jgi:hypothetical protein
MVYSRRDGTIRVSMSEIPDRAAPAEVVALIERAGVRVRPDEWPLIMRAYGVTRASSVRLVDTLRRLDAPAFDFMPDTAAR